MPEKIEKFVTPGPLPTARQREILVILIEECAEVQQRAAKALRFGLGEIEPGQKLNNTNRLSDEVGDLIEITNMAKTEGVLSAYRVALGMLNKRDRLEKYMQTEKADA